MALLTLRMDISLHNSYLRILKSGSEREWSFLWFEPAESSHHPFWSNGELVTKTIIRCNCVVKSRGGRNFMVGYCKDTYLKLRYFLIFTTQLHLIIDIVTGTVSQSEKIARTCCLISEEPEQRPLFSTLQNLFQKIFARDWCIRLKSKNFVPGFNMGHHTKNSNIYGRLALKLCLCCNDFYPRNLKSGIERQWSFLWFEQVERSHHFFWSNGELVTKTIIRCNCVVKIEKYLNLW